MRSASGWRRSYGRQASSPDLNKHDCNSKGLACAGGVDARVHGWRRVFAQRLLASHLYYICPILNRPLVAAAMQCLHVFHSACIEAWFRRNKTSCPVCRIASGIPHSNFLSQLSSFRDQPPRIHFFSFLYFSFPLGNQENRSKMLTTRL